MDIVSLGEMLIDLVPAETGKRLVEVSAFLPKPGGAPANVAVAGARLGAATAFVGKVGDDFFGHYLEEVLQREGVDTRGMRFDAEARTTLAFIAQPSAALNEYIFYRNPGADQRLRPDELDGELLSDTRVLHFGSLSLTDEPSRSATYEAVRLARRAQALISFDVNYRPALWRSPAAAAREIEQMLPHADVLKVNETELKLLSGTADVEQGSARLVARGTKLVVVTLGAEGSYFRSAQGSGSVPGLDVNAVDSTGAGDSFIGALLTQLLRYGIHDLERLPAALEYANAAGALTATRRGAIPALPMADEVQEFLYSRSSAASAPVNASTSARVL